MRRKGLTYLPPNTHASATPLARNVKDQRSAKFVFDRRVDEIFSALQKVATEFARMRADEPTLVTTFFDN